MDGIRLMKCLECGIEWAALCYTAEDELECPICHTMIDVGEVIEKYKKKGRDGHE